jgi:hypothetical protein
MSNVILPVGVSAGRLLIHSALVSVGAVVDIVFLVLFVKVHRSLKSQRGEYQALKTKADSKGVEEAEVTVKGG